MSCNKHSCALCSVHVYKLIHNRIIMRLLTFHRFLTLVVLVHIAQSTENSEERPVQKPEVSTEAPSSNDATQATEFKSAENSVTENTGGDEKKYALGSLCNYCTYCKV